MSSDEDDPRIHLGRSKAHNKLENHLEAVADAQRAVELDPKLAAAYAEQGRALYNLEEYESAKEAFDMACVLEPARKIHKNWLNMCKVALGQEVQQEPLSQAMEAHQAQQEQIENLNAGSYGTSTAKAAEKSASKAPTAVTIDDPEFAKYWRAPAAAAAAEVDAAVSGSSGRKYRHQWFQNDNRVEVNIMAKKMPKERVSVTIEPGRLKVATKDEAGKEEYVFEVELYREIDTTASKYEVLGSKIEVILAKKVPRENWKDLEARAAEPAIAAAAAREGEAPASAAYPYAGKKVDWNKVEQEVQKEEKEEKLEGDAAVMKFFKEIFKDSDEDTRRAMMKSYQESGGKSLSTNWKDVGSRSFKNDAED
jgi:suppressor of G2 allele of SKP1